MSDEPKHIKDRVDAIPPEKLRELRDKLRKKARKLLSRMPQDVSEEIAGQMVGAYDDDVGDSASSPILDIIASRLHPDPFERGRAWGRLTKRLYRDLDKDKLAQVGDTMGDEDDDDLGDDDGEEGTDV